MAFAYYYTWAGMKSEVWSDGMFDVWCEKKKKKKIARKYSK